MTRVAHRVSASLRVGLAALAVAGLTSTAWAQGCMPIRFVSPAQGGRGDAYLEQGSWRSSVAFRGLYANQFFVGTRSRPDLAPQGQPVLIHNQSADFGLTYALTDRVAVTLNVPWLAATVSNVYADGLRHQNQASGIGDINVRVNSWLWDQQNNPRGNVALGAGVKAPTGNVAARGTAWRKDGTSYAFPVAWAIQPGDGGWAILLQGEAFRQVTSRAFVYASGNYSASLRESSGIPRDLTGLMIGVPDVRSVRAGTSFHLLSRGELSQSARTVLSASIGWREDATTKRDLFGGKDMLYRAPGIVGYVDDGLSLVRGRYVVSASVPVRLYLNYRRSDADVVLNRPGGGDMARYLVLLDFSRRY